jgi:excisionase family DNA binding protein
MLLFAMHTTRPENQIPDAFPSINPRPLALSVEQAAELAGVSRSLLYEEMRRPGGLKYVKIRGRRLILVDDLREWLVSLRAS